jgi:hypothetical protein
VIVNDTVSEAHQNPQTRRVKRGPLAPGNNRSRLQLHKQQQAKLAGCIDKYERVVQRYQHKIPGVRKENKHIKAA